MTAISTSKIKKIIVIIKKRKEKEFRILWCGSNPHSNGDIFSRVDILGFIKIVARSIIKRIKIQNKAERTKNTKIFYIKSFNWKLNILFVLIFFF